MTLVGRVKELVNINGVKYLPHDLETAIYEAHITGITPGFVTCFSYRPSPAKTEEIYVIYQHAYDINDNQTRISTLHAIVRIVFLSTGSRPHVLPLPPSRLEKSTLGKLSRAKISTSLSQGHYKDMELLDAQILQAYRSQHYCEPRDDTERRLLSLFIETLHYDNTEMGIDTPILDTGISSVDLIRLKSACETAFGVADIPMIIIMTNTTIRALALAMKQLQQTPSSDYKNEYNPVVTLQPNGSKNELWLIHPGIGEILVFLNLVQYFPDRPIYALRPRGFNPGANPFQNQDEIVDSYYRGVKTKQPNGPYALAGYSYGSVLAFEISKLLEADGEKVQFLGSFNLPPHIKERMRQLDWTEGVKHIAHFCALADEDRLVEMVPSLRLVSHDEQVSRILAIADKERCAQLGLTHQSLRTWTNVAFSLQKIGWEYEPSGNVAQMDIFYCQPLRDVAKTREEYRNTKLNRWEDFVRNGDVRFHEVDGEHYTMIGPEHVGRFQLRLKRVLAERGL